MMICSTCGCSLIRLGINISQAPKIEYKSVEYCFCCQGCLAIFQKKTDKYLRETLDIKVCPTCLAEKPVGLTVPFKFNDHELHFCRCPYCLDTFQNDPQFYIDRMSGKTDFKGLFSNDEKACCH
jgi:YHS domain-containing protein